MTPNASWDQCKALDEKHTAYRDKSGCQYCDGYCHGGCREGYMQAYSNAEAALAKARGQS